MTREPITPTMDLFSAISDEMRLKILMLLDQAEFTVNEIKDIFTRATPGATSPSCRPAGS